MSSLVEPSPPPSQPPSMPCRLPLAPSPPCVADAVKNFLAVLLASELTVTVGVPQLSPLQLQACAHALLQAVNAVPSPEGFRAPDGMKVTRAFGLSLLSAPGHWEAVVSTSLRREGAIEGLGCFLHAFGRSFVDGVVEPHEVELGELVWAADFSVALHERGSRRRVRAQEHAGSARAAAAASGRSTEHAHDELRHLVQAQLGAH
eukprot:scaffold16555_cov130-Isochrysis_galbana.AAC.5